MKIKELSVVKISTTAASKYNLNDAVGVVTSVNSEKGVRTFLVTWYVGGKNFTDVLPIKNDGWYWMFEHELEYVGELYMLLNAFAHPTNAVPQTVKPTTPAKPKKDVGDASDATGKTTLPPIVVIPKVKSAASTPVQTTQAASTTGVVPSSFAGKNLLASGVFKFFDRKSIIDSIKSTGANYISSVCPKLDVLVIGDNPGPNKIDKAKLLGIPIITEKEYMRKIGLIS